jgi:hypothetical protein
MVSLVMCGAARRAPESKRRAENVAATRSHLPPSGLESLAPVPGRVARPRARIRARMRSLAR